MSCTLEAGPTGLDVNELGLVPVGVVEADGVPRQRNPKSSAIHVQRDIDRALGLLLQPEGCIEERGGEPSKPEHKVCMPILWHTR